MAVRRTDRAVRRLTADELGIGGSDAIGEHGSNRPDDPGLDPNDPRLVEVQDLLEYFGGVIFSGPPGTSKSWYASKIGTALVDGDTSRITFLQFHPSYQYEDFMQGIVPRGDEAGGFEVVPRPFLRMCQAADRDRDRTHVLVIDELSRADPGRVFGEALTYVEKSKRDLSFELSLGGEAIVPPNLVILATMNPLDRGVDEVDAAFERRFAKIAMEPDRAILGEMLQRNGVEEAMARRLMGFFSKTNALARRNPLAAVGHTFFMEVYDEQSLQRVWDYQLRYLFAKAYRLNPEGLAETEADWERIFGQPPGDGNGEPQLPTEPVESDAPAN